MVHLSLRLKQAISLSLIVFLFSLFGTTALAMPTEVNVYGDREFDALGSSGSYLPGDLNGDTIPDIITTSGFADSADGSLGFVGLVRAISGADGTTLFSSYGDRAFDGLGFSGSFLPGDLNGDTIPDIVVTAEGAASADGSMSCLLYTSPSPRDQRGSRMPSSA